jgi:hypothetical protein
VGADPVAADAGDPGRGDRRRSAGRLGLRFRTRAARHIGYACGTLTSGLTAGILLGSLVATAINSLYTPVEVADYAWRIPFLLGGVFGLFSVYLRRWLHETPVFAELQLRKALAEEVPLRAVLRDHRGAIAISMLLTWLLSAGIVVVILMTPTVLQTVYTSPTTSLQANSLAIVFLSLGCIVSGALADRLARAGVRVRLPRCWPAPGPSTTAWPTIRLAVPAVCPDRPAGRHHRRGAVRHGQGVPAGGALQRLVVLLQRGLRHLRRPDADGGQLLLKESPMGPAYYVAVLCGVGIVVGGYLWKKGR